MEPPARLPVRAGRAAGLVSTIDDYLAFGQMLLGSGKHGGQRILSRPSVETMTSDQLTPAQKAVSGFLPGFFDSRGWGFGVSVVTRRDDARRPRSARFGWDGGLGTLALGPQGGHDHDPDDPGAWTSPNPPNICLDFWTSAYQAIDD